jgi:hypothetical protein
MTSGDELLAQIARVREELCAVDRELREFGGTKDHGRLIANLRECANDLEAAVYRALSEINFAVKGSAE